MSGNCGNCKHWNGAQREDFRQLVTQRWSAVVPEAEYEAARTAADEADRLYGACLAIPMGPAEVGDPLPLALAIDGSEYYAEVFTRAEFGCTLHEPKPS